MRRTRPTLATTCRSHESSVRAAILLVTAAAGPRGWAEPTDRALGGACPLFAERSRPARGQHTPPRGAPRRGLRGDRGRPHARRSSIRVEDAEPDVSSFATVDEPRGERRLRRRLDQRPRHGQDGRVSPEVGADANATAVSPSAPSSCFARACWRWRPTPRPPSRRCPLRTTSKIALRCPRRP